MMSKSFITVISFIHLILFCASSHAEVVTEVKNFSPKPNGFGFENGFINKPADVRPTDLNADYYIYVYGQEQACMSPTGECVLKPSLQKDMENQRQTGLHEGNCYGMSVASLRLLLGQDYSGKKLPSDFQSGVDKTFELQSGNDPVRQYIVTYFLMQAFAGDGRVGGTPVEVLDKLIEATNAGNGGDIGKYAASLNFFETKDGKFSGGHSVLPYKVDNKYGNEYWIYVYDNNYPNDNERVVKINRAQNSWVYEGATTKPGEAVSEYRGDADTKSIMFDTLASLESRPYPCASCETNQQRSRRGRAAIHTVEFEFAGEGKMLVQTPTGQKIGFDFEQGREVNEVSGATAKPFIGFFAKKDRPPVYQLPMPTDNQPFTVKLTGKDLNSETEGSLSVEGPGYLIGFQDVFLEINEVLTITIRPDGREIGFTSNSDGETPTVFLTLPGENSKPGYIFEAGGVDLEANQTITYTLDPDSSSLYITDSDDNTDTFDLEVTRVDTTGSQKLNANQVATQPHSKSRLNFGAWDGQTGNLLFQDDTEGNGFDDNQAIPLTPDASKDLGKCVATFIAETGELQIPCIDLTGKSETYKARLKLVPGADSSLTFSVQTVTPLKVAPTGN